MADILVIQLARFGDFLQTTPLLQGLKAEDRSNRVGVLIDPANNAVAEKSGCVDEIINVSVDQLSNVIGAGADIAENYRALDAVCRQLSSRYFDLVINLNYLTVAALLSRIPGAGKILGYTIGKDGAMIKSGWFVFFNHMVKYRVLSPFNLVDYFYYLYFNRPADQQISFQVSRADETAAARLLPAHQPRSGRKMIVIHPGTRNEMRAWPISCFSALIDKYLQPKNIDIVLTGSSADRRLVEKIINSVGGEKNEFIHNLAGKAPLSVMAAILKRADMLLCADTGILHLAAAVKTKILALFIGPASVYSTGPYCDGAVILQTAPACAADCIEDMPCRDQKCRTLISPEVVYRVSLQVLADARVSAGHCPGVDLLTAKNDGSGISYEPVSKTVRHQKRRLMHCCYRRMGTRMMLNGKGRGDIDELMTVSENCSEKKRLSEIFDSGRQVQAKAFTAGRWLAEERLKPENGFWLPWIDAYIESSEYSDRDAAAYLNALDAGIRYIGQLARA